MRTWLEALSLRPSRIRVYLRNSCHVTLGISWDLWAPCGDRLVISGSWYWPSIFQGQCQLYPKDTSRTRQTEGIQCQEGNKSYPIIIRELRVIFRPKGKHFGGRRLYLRWSNCDDGDNIRVAGACLERCGVPIRVSFVISGNEAYGDDRPESITKQRVEKSLPFASSTRGCFIKCTQITSKCNWLTQIRSIGHSTWHTITAHFDSE